MFFSKFPHPRNFTFVGATQSLGRLQIGQHEVELSAESFEGGVHHIFASGEWPPNQCLAPLDLPKPAQLGVSINGGRIEIRDESGKVVVRGSKSGSFGLCAKKSIFSFEVPSDARYFGMGEKNFGDLELSGKRSLFWNTDVWSDFHFAHWENHSTDPSYCSVPYVAVRVADGYVGFLLHNPSPTFIETPGREDDRAFTHWQETSPSLLLGSYDGQPDLWVLTARSLAELTRKLQKLVGTTPMPPLWSLGYHQSRWGYGGHDDLTSLDQNFNKYKIPCDGLWLDLDYMDGYRIFKVAESMFPHGVQATADILAKSRRRIVPIIDPGVKSEEGYRVYDDGITHGVFCKNPEGQPYIGIVWPGETVYPDFTLKEARDWWAGYSKEFRESGFGGCWVDMNDPSTGPAEPDSMLFKYGQSSHAEHRNQYALGMQMATRQGFLQAVPNERPFVLSRSGFIGTSRYSAIWTGDNYANDLHLKLAVSTVLGLSISGIPFAGADVGGFGGNTDSDMMVRWTQLAFLSPFMRNHTNIGATHQEPWAYPAAIRNLVAHYVRLRYQFLPYLYSLFAQQETAGDPMVRPLIYDFDERAFDEVADQVMVGPHLLHAPMIQAKAKARSIVLPGKSPWFDLANGEWVKPGVHERAVPRQSTPVFARAGALVPVQPKLPKDNRVTLKSVDVLVAVPADWVGETSFDYVADDGLTLNYLKGKRSTVRLTAQGDGKSLALTADSVTAGAGAVKVKFVLLSPVDKVTVDGQIPSKTQAKLKLTGQTLVVTRLD